jgi:acyl homoserine lactone synthase
VIFIPPDEVHAEIRMQILTVLPDRYIEHQNLLKQMYRLRANVFGERLEWDVNITDGGERDQYDDLNPTYILAIYGGNKVVGCARLLPAVGPTMLERTFPQLLADGSLHATSAMIESSRFCVDTTLPAGRGGGQLHLVTLTMFAGIIEWSMANGYDKIVTATDLRFERILNRAGWPMTRLGKAVAIGNTVAVAGTLPATRESLEQVRPPNYRSALSSAGGRSERRAA